MVGVLCPSRFEFEALDRDALRREGAPVVLSGMGKVRAAVGCSRLLREHPQLKTILLVGFAGGLSHGLKVGDVVEPQAFIEQDYNCEPFETFPNLIEREGARLLSESVDALMLTQDRFLKENPYRDGEYAKRWPKIACDMESYAVAEFCRSSRLKLGVVKLISDSADETADHDFLKACKELSPKLNRVTAESVRALAR